MEVRVQVAVLGMVRREALAVARSERVEWVAQGPLDKVTKAAMDTVATRRAAAEAAQEVRELMPTRLI